MQPRQSRNLTNLDCFFGEYMMTTEKTIDNHNTLNHDLKHLFGLID